MTESKQKKHAKSGRKPKSDPAIYRYGIKLNAEENGRFELLFQKSGQTYHARFIKSMIFGREMKVVKIDKATMDYYIRLTNFYHQFQAIGNNYNQVVRAVQRNFSEQQAAALIQRLQRTTLELIVVNKQVIALTKEYEERWLER